MPVDPKCIFCRIIGGELPSIKVYESEDVLAFMDINPVEKGHVLVIPKPHHATLMETPDALLGRVIAAVRLVAAALMECGADGVNVLQSNHAAAGQEVWHLHFHIIPRSEAAATRSWVSGNAAYASDDERAQYAARIRQALAALAGDDDR